MMTANELKSKFDQLIAKAKLEEGFNLLDTHVSKLSEIWEDEILLLQSQFSELNRERIVGIIKRDDYTIVKQSIQSRIRESIKKLNDEDIVKPVIDENECKILIICRDDTDEFYMRSFCGQKTNLKYEVKQLKVYELPTNYKFIIFDNHSIKNIEDKFELKDDEVAHLELMKEYIEEFAEHKKYMIHFGEMTDVVSKNRDIIYSANSKFALYSRIMEMNKYIDDDRLYKIASIEKYV